MTQLNDFKKPVNIISLLIGVLGIILSLLFYFNGKKIKSISYSIAETPSLIFDSQNSTSAIKLYEKDTILIKRNVYLLTGTIWNSGNLPIDKTDVRIPITLNLNKSDRILDFSVTKQKDASIASFVLNKIGNNILKLDWKYFDPNFGFSFQIIYEGDISNNFQLYGKILDISNFHKESIAKESEGFWDWKMFFIIAFFLGSIIVAFFEKSKHGKPKTSTLIIIVLYLLLILLILSLHFFYNTSNPI